MFARTPDARATYTTFLQSQQELTLAICRNGSHSHTDAHIRRSSSLQLRVAQEHCTHDTTNTLSRTRRIHTDAAAAAAASIEELKEERRQQSGVLDAWHNKRAEVVVAEAVTVVVTVVVVVPGERQETRRKMKRKRDESQKGSNDFAAGNAVMHASPMHGKGMRARVSILRCSALSLSPLLSSHLLPIIGKRLLCLLLLSLFHTQSLAAAAFVQSDAKLYHVPVLHRRQQQRRRQLITGKDWWRAWEEVKEGNDTHLRGAGEAVIVHTRSPDADLLALSCSGVAAAAAADDSGCSLQSCVLLCTSAIDLRNGRTRARYSLPLFAVSLSVCVCGVCGVAPAQPLKPDQREAERKREANVE